LIGIVFFGSTREHTPCILASQFGATLSLPTYLTLLQKHSIRKFYEFGSFQISLQVGSPLLFNADEQLSRGRVLNCVKFSQVSSDSLETRVFETSDNQIYTFDSNAKVTDGPARLLEAKKTFSNHSVTLVLKSDASTSNEAFAKLAARASRIIVDRFDLSAQFNLSADQASQRMRADGSINAIPLNGFKLEFLNSFKIRITDATISELTFSDQDLADGLIVQGNAQKGSLFDDSSTNGRYELSWKADNRYEVKLDFDMKTVKSIQ
jgi:hypothetical protein